MKKTVGKLRSQGGFTLIEIISVLVLIGIVSVVVIARMTSTSEYDLYSQVEVVKAHLRQAQNRAMNANDVCGKACGIHFTGSHYNLFKNADKNDELRFLGQDSQDVQLPTGMTISHAPIVAFDAWGKPYSDDAATTALTSEMTITLNKGSESREIKITPNTGFVK